MKDAQFWHTAGDDRVQCELCPHRCTIAPDQAGRCRVRRNCGGRLVAASYGRISSAHLDPIEKKPLYHFRPGSMIFSIGGWGCNFRCRFCQNWSISQQGVEETQAVEPAVLVERGAAMDESVGIAYTYNEPLIAFEFVKDCAQRMHGLGRANVLVTNGYIEPDPAAELLPFINALNIDVKSMEESFYREYCGGSLKPVLAFAEQAAQAGCLVEITNLLIPGLNDGPDVLASLAQWIRTTLGEKTPLHLSAYRPMYKLDRPATSLALLDAAYDICSRELPYVYLGNVISSRGQDTLCPKCGATLVSRRGYCTRVTGVRDGACAACGRAADLVTG